MLCTNPNLAVSPATRGSAEILRWSDGDPIIVQCFARGVDVDPPWRRSREEKERLRLKNENFF